MKTKENIRTYKTAEEAFEAKHDLAREFLKKVDIQKMDVLIKKHQIAKV
jgi:uncharacterized phosphosugar-binding protein